MHLAIRCKKTQLAGIHAAQNILILLICRFPVTFIDGSIHRLCITKAVHQKDNLLLLYFIFLKHSFFCILDLRFTLHGIFFFQRIQIINDHLRHRIIIIQNILIFCNICKRCLMLLHQRLDFQTDQLVQTHLQNCLCLPVGKPEHGCHLLRSFRLKLDLLRRTCCQTFFCIPDGRASTQDLNDQVDHVTRLDQTLLDFFFILLFFQQRLVFSGCKFKLEIYMMFDDTFESQYFRSAIGYREHIDTKGILQSGLFIKHVNQIVHICITLHFNYNTDSFLGRLIGNVYDVTGLLCLHQIADIVQKFTDSGSDHGVRDFGNNDLLPSAFYLFHIYFSTNLDLSGSSLINFCQIIFIDNDPACRKIRSFDVLHQLFCRDVIVLHVCLNRIHNLAQVMCRNTGCHTNCDSFRTVQQKVRNSYRKNCRLFFCLIKIRYKINDIFVQIGKICLLCDFRQSCFSITHGCSPVSFNGAEVSMTIYQDHSFFEFLCHNNQRFIDRAVSMWMIFTHGIPDNTRAFTVWSVITDSQLIHVIECSSLYRFQTIPDIREGSGNDNTHGIVNI